MPSILERFFDVRDRGSTLGIEVRSGIASFLASSYVLLINSQMFSTKAGVPSFEVAVATAITGAVGSILLGVTANLPLAVAPAVGLNAYLASVIDQFPERRIQGFRNTMTLSFIVGIALVIIAPMFSCGCIVYVVQRFPKSLRHSLVASIGFLLVFLSFKNFSVNYSDARLYIFLFGLFLIELLTLIRVPGATLISILVSALLLWVVSNQPLPSTLFLVPKLNTIWYSIDFNVFLESWKETLGGTLGIFWIILLDLSVVPQSILAADPVFQSFISSWPNNMYAVWTVLITGLATIVGGITGSGVCIPFAESSVGIHEGGKTGLTAVITGACFLISVVLMSLFQSIPQGATAPPLFIAGAFMLKELEHIEWSNESEIIPAIMTLCVVPFTNSLLDGFALGLLVLFLEYVVHILARRQYTSPASLCDNVDVTPELSGVSS
eukprot:jgi/Galph1/5998/GphlegSOOS_G4588.1